MATERSRAHSAWRAIGLAIGVLALAGGATVDAREIIQRPRTYVDLKYAYTVRQQWDFSCGAAALATILKHHYGMPVTEAMLFWMIAKRYNLAELKQKAEVGLSFEDLIYAAKQLGFNAQAAVVQIGELEKLSGPVIIQVDKKFEHFVVLRKKTADLAYVSDPALGQMTLDNAEFAKEFKGPVLAIWPSYIKGDYFSGLNVIRDPISVSRALTRALQDSVLARKPF